MNNEKAKQIQNDIRTWLTEEGWKITDQEYPNTFWAFVAEDSTQIRIVVVQNNKPSDQIHLVGNVTFPPEHLKAFNALHDEKRKSIFWDLRFKLLAMGVEFSSLGEPLDKIQLSKKIYHDGLSKDAFFQRLSATKNGMYTVIWGLQRELQDVTPPTGQTDTFVH